MIKSIKRYFFIFLFFYFTTLSYAKTTAIIYINGAANTQEMALEGGALRINQEYFKQILLSYNIGSTSSVIFDPYDNIATSIDLSRAEFSCQAAITKASFPKDKFNIPTPLTSNTVLDYYKNLSIIYGSTSTISKVYSCNFQNSSGVLKNKHDNLISKITSHLSKDRKVILIGHSQGNYFLESAIAEIYTNYRNKYADISSVEIGTFTPSAFYRNSYINFKQDNVVYGLKISYFTDADYPPIANAVICIDCKNNIAASKDAIIELTKDTIVKNGDSSAHGIRSYLSGNIRVNDSIFIRKYISEKVSKEIRRLNLYDYLKSKKPTQIALTLNTTTASSWLSRTFNQVFAILGIRDAMAQMAPNLFAFINTPYTVRVDGTGFDGNEAVNIVGSMCDPSTIQRGSGYFTQACTGGNAAGDGNKIRVYDTQYDLDIEVPKAYQTMSLRGPVITPLAPALSEPTSGTIRLSWGAVSGATGYEISRAGQTLATVGTVTSYDETGRTPGTMYCYRLRTIQNGTMSAYSPEACLTANTLQCQGQWTTSQYSPGQTETRTLACQSGYTGNISQTHTCQSTGQWGQTSETNTCTATPAPSCPGSWSSAKYLIGQTEEKYENTCPAGTQGQVRTWHTCQASGTSAVWGGLAQSDNCTAYLASPTNLALSSVIGGMQLSWSPASGATRYYIYKNGDANNYYSSVTGTSWIDSNVVNGQSYSYAIKAYSNLNNSSVYSPLTSWVSKIFEAGNLVINPPQNVTASQYTDEYGRKSIRLTWSTVPNVDSYYIYRRGYSNPNGNGEFLAAVNGVLNGAAPQFMDYAQLNLISGNSYCYYMRAANGNNQSVNSYPDACSYAP